MATSVKLPDVLQKPGALATVVTVGALCTVCVAVVADVAQPVLSTTFRV